MASLASLSALAPSAQRMALHPLICHLAPSEHWEQRFHTGPHRLGRNGLFLPSLTPELCVPVALIAALAIADDLSTLCAPVGPRRVPDSATGTLS